MSEGEYEDDFEAYQDDFEDEEPEPHHKHMPPAPGRLPLSPLGGNKAQELQRPRIPLTANASTTWPTPSKPSMLVSRAQMGLSDAQRAALAQRKARWDAIRPQVRLQEAIMDEMFSMPPLSQYALSQMGRGQYRGLVAASSQTGADAQAESCQTDTIPVNSISSQAPDEPAMQPSPAQRSGSSKALAAAKSSVPSGRSSAKNSITGQTGGPQPGWERRLAAFVHSTGAVMASLLAQRAAHAGLQFVRTTAINQGGLSSGVLTLSHEQLLRGRRVASIAKPSSSHPLVLCAYGSASTSSSTDNQDRALHQRGLLCAWDLSSPSAPAAVLQSEGAPTACCWADDRCNLAVAGLAEGGLCLWDLRESAAQHPMESIGGDPSECCRRPTYTTEWEGDAASAGPIVALQVVPPQKHGEAAQGGALAGRGYTSLISLTSWGHVSVYTIQELSSLEAGGSGEALLGLRIGGRARLLKTASGLPFGRSAALHSRLPPTHRQNAAEQEQHAVVAMEGAGASRSAAAGTDAVAMRSTWALASLPGDGSQFLVGGEDGRVMRGSLYGRPPPPKEYFLEDPLHALNTSTSSRITSITFSPCLPEAFLAIHAPSAIAVYSIHHSLPRLAMQGFSSSPLTHACWSPVRPAVFFVLDALSSLHCFDLLRDRTAPVLVAPLCGTTKSSIMSMEVSSVQQNSGSQTRQPHWLALGFADGHVEVQELSSRFVQQVKDEDANMQSIVR